MTLNKRERSARSNVDVPSGVHSERPLEGTLVVAVEHAVAAPLASRQLYDLGARVIKVERPGVGDFARGYDKSVLGQSSYFVWLNRGKESIELDLKDEADLAFLRKVIGKADVFIQNLAPGAAKRLGLGAAELRQRHPRLVHCAITGYGPTGPYAKKKAYDLLVQCETGLLAVTGTPSAPAKVGISVADIATGTHACMGILAALVRRGRTGDGATIEISMLDAMGEWMMQPTYMGEYGSTPPRRTGARHASIAPYGPYRTMDGQIFLAVQNDREWDSLCRRVLERPDLVSDPRFADVGNRVINDAVITKIITNAFRSRRNGELMDVLGAHGIAAAQLRNPRDFFRHPQLAARERWQDVETPGGTIAALKSPIEIDGVDSHVGAVPRLGGSNSDIRNEFE